MRGVTAHKTTGSRQALQFLARAWREFALVPTLVVGCFAVLAVLTVVADQAHGSTLRGLRDAVGTVIGEQAASTTLQAIATGLVTVTSITFSVLLLAVQQTASSLSPVVFDQFVRRRSNQVFLGFFVGLAVYSYVAMAAVQDGMPPILGAAMATVLTVVAMLFLLVLIYLTIDQMQASSVIRLIHERTLLARGREGELVRRTRRSERSNDPVSATYYAETSGYVNGVDLDRLAEVLEEVPDSEIRLLVTIGQYVAHGDAVATVRDDDEEVARRLAGEVREAILIAGRRDLDYDAKTGIDELANIAWTNGSTARQNPVVAGQALDALRDLILRWLDEDPAGERSEQDALAVVYPDNDLERLLDVLYSVLVAAHESHQTGTAAAVVGAYASIVERPGAEAVRSRLLADLERAERLVAELPPSLELERSRERLAAATGGASRRAALAVGSPAGASSRNGG